MPSYISTVTTFPNKVVSVVSTDSTPYPVLLQSFGSFVFGVKRVYMKTNTIDQIVENLQFVKYDVDGNIESYVDGAEVDPYQYQNSVNFELVNNVYLNGRVSMNFSILPNENVYLILYVDQIALRDFVPQTDIFDNDFFNSQYNILHEYKQEI